MTLILTKSDDHYIAQMFGHQGRHHNWSNKSHLKQYSTGFQLFPTVETFIISGAVKHLYEKGKTVAANKLERYVKDEMQKHFMIEFFNKELREQKPLLYSESKPSELQITCFLKSNSKIIKDALNKVIENEPIQLCPAVEDIIF